ncbi:MAG: hypothetical protein FWF53_12590 [Candidatus Azobacteroides sp.]|nr:hypothetical protein [Candidatus Azobacteroides sp.]
MAAHIRYQLANLKQLTFEVTDSCHLQSKNRRYEIQEFDPASRIYKAGRDAEYIASEINIKELFLGAGQEKVLILNPEK